MTEEFTKEQYENRIAELEQQLEESKNNNGFDEIKSKYEKIIEDKNNKITELETEVNNTKKKVDDTVNDLNDEIQKKLEANEQYQKMLATVEKLEKEKAELTVDTLIKQGKIVPAQKELALEFCLNDSEKFAKYYENAKPVIEINERKSHHVPGLAEKLTNYLK